MVEWILLFVGIAISIIITYLTSRSLVDPIRSMTGAMAKLAEGDMTIEVPALDKTDEIGEMAQAAEISAARVVVRATIRPIARHRYRARCNRTFRRGEHDVSNWRRRRRPM